MIEKIKQLASLLPLLIAGIYISGFIIVNSYLSTYSVQDVESLSFNYLKAGIFYFLFLTISVSCIFASFGKPTDNLQTNYHQYFILINNSLFVCLVLSFILFRPFAVFQTPYIVNFGEGIPL